MCSQVLIRRSWPWREIARAVLVLARIRASAFPPTLPPLRNRTDVGHEYLGWIGASDFEFLVVVGDYRDVTARQLPDQSKEHRLCNAVEHVRDERRKVEPLLK